MKSNVFQEKKIPISLLSEAYTPPFLTISKTFLPPDFYSIHLGFFCRQEIKIEKLTKVPLRFRLGSVQECDRMEGKNRLTNEINF